MSLLFGIAAGVLVLLFGISAGDGGVSFTQLRAFLNIPGLFITVLGTFCALAASHPLSLISKIPSHFRVIAREAPDPAYYIEVMADLSRQARKKGLLALEDALAEGGFEDDVFLSSSVMMVVDALSPEKLRAQIEAELANIDTRHEAQAAIYDKGAALAPGFGIIGTVAGLVNMLSSVNIADAGGAAALSGGMVSALAATFYGIVLANLIFIPIASQLRAVHAREILCKEIIAEGVISIQSGENPHNTFERLVAYLPTELRRHLETEDSA
ncbi:MAG: MotA/TolQ/ExbB proton channel family protein [Oscillospiraceae bacterium]|nr:MotA/TolQ/ExbB proton channel family protein [Oscillospiraceae bacterium]